MIWLALTLTSMVAAHGDQMAGSIGDLLAADSPAIETSGGGKKNSRVSVNGCSNSAHFSLLYIDPDKDPLEKAKCLKFDMHGKLAAFMNQNLEACIELAGDRALGHGALGADLRKGGNRIYHDGCIGDGNHQAGGSWHNEGLALDIVAFKIGDRIFNYNDTVDPKTEDARRTDSFFTHFRRCWANKVLAYDDSCRNLGRDRTGTVGKENGDHHRHLHVSLPCRSISSGRSTKMARLSEEPYDP